MGGRPWGCAKWAKWAKKPNVGKRGKNGQKMMNKNEKDPYFLLEMIKTIFHPTHPVRKK